MAAHALIKCEGVDAVVAHSAEVPVHILLHCDVVGVAFFYEDIRVAVGAGVLLFMKCMGEDNFPHTCLFHAIDLARKDHVAEFFVLSNSCCGS